MSAATADALGARVAELRERRVDAGAAFFDAEAARLADCCHSMAERFAAGGRLVALGHSASARSDVRHVAVEFVHPVIVGKRALPAIGLAPEGGPLVAQVEAVVEAGDIAIAFGADEPDAAETVEALAAARASGALTIAFASAGAEWEFVPGADDPFVAQELVETLYHVLWELVHVFLDHSGLLAGGTEGHSRSAGASAFLYPFLERSDADVAAVVDDVRRSVLAKAAEIGELRTETLDANAATLAGAAIEVRRLLDAGGRLLACGNGGSATDAMDLVADLVQPRPGWPVRRAIDLTADPSIITAIANDVGVERIFQRQVIAYGRRGDVLCALSTSGNSQNLIAALAEARKRGLTTLAMVGYDGGRIAEEGLADHVVVVRSQNIPRIQEAQASAYHVLRELIEEAP